MNSRRCSARFHGSSAYTSSNIVLSAGGGSFSASSIAGRIGRALGGSGGGKADLAQAGGKNEALLPGALKEAVAAVRELLRAGRS